MDLLDRIFFLKTYYWPILFVITCLTLFEICSIKNNIFDIEIWISFLVPFWSLLLYTRYDDLWISNLLKGFVLVWCIWLKVPSLNSLRFFSSFRLLNRQFCRFWIGTILIYFYSYSWLMQRFLVCFTIPLFYRTCHRIRHHNIYFWLINNLNQLFILILHSIFFTFLKFLQNILLFAIHFPFSTWLLT